MQEYIPTGSGRTGNLCRHLQLDEHVQLVLEFKGEQRDSPIPFMRPR